MPKIKAPTFDPCKWRGHSASGMTPVPCPTTLSPGMIVSAKCGGRTTIFQLTGRLPNDEYQGQVTGFEPPVDSAGDIACDDIVRIPRSSICWVHL